MCAVCGTIFEGGNCRNLAARCYDSHEEENEPHGYLAGAYDKTEPKQPGDGVEHPDRHGHFRRLNRDNPDFLRISMNKAAYHNRMRFEADERYLDNMYKKIEEWRHKPSALQRLAQAYHYGRWESVKQAAVAMGYETAIQRRLDEMNIPQLVQDQLELAPLFTEVAESLRDLDVVDAQTAIRALLDRIHLENEINGILGGDNEPET